MRIVIDTNVLISGTFWSGASFKVIQLVQQGIHDLILSKDILKEYNKILHSEHIMDKQAYTSEKAASVHKLVQLAIIVEPKQKLAIVKDDPDDDKFIEAALEGHAKFIVTQDKHLLDIQEYNGIKMLKPEEFLEL
jgi:putative PIN family toxin of toxin-antitoxin system